jgi:hypothetical protein
MTAPTTGAAPKVIGAATAPKPAPPKAPATTAFTVRSTSAVSPFLVASVTRSIVFATDPTPHEKLESGTSVIAIAKSISFNINWLLPYQLHPSTAANSVPPN